MDPNKQRIAIAAACAGWEVHHGGRYCAILNCENPMLSGRLFDPLHDLNAMHEACERVGAVKLHTWPMELRKIVVRDATIMRLEIDDHIPDYYFYNATPKQRAEAFLRTLNKWEES